MTAIASTAFADGSRAIEHEVYWSDGVDYQNDCANTFPLRYGSALRGQARSELERIPAKPLLREVVYHVSTTSGATGYGGGSFIIRAGGSVENLH